jgi:hypothetical protein
VTSGYSGTPLVKKLGIKPGDRLAILNAPDDYETTLGPIPEGAQRLRQLGKAMDFVQFFTRSRSELARSFPKLRDALAYHGGLWVSWPKKSSGVESDLNENIIREIGLQNGLVDVKVAAVDEVWSGLKFVYRLEDRR